ncbi:hypothetical protein L218DRAFT_1007274 [Marasmius fiardii PR-910]|nr:hypothetical protein L218DRAFT_1007274 [Marasmius fiardii PR-910]
MPTNIVFAFGASDNSYFIAAGGRTRDSHLPSGMYSALVGKLNPPIEYASMSASGECFVVGRTLNEKTRRARYWNVGTLAGLKNKLKTDHSSVLGISFPYAGAYCWYSHNGTTYQSSFHWLEKDQDAWIKKMKGNFGSDFRPFLGVGQATVLVYANNVIRWHACADRLASTLTAASKQHLNIRYMNLSPKHRDWFYIQFQDDTVVWYANDTIAKHLKEYAKDKGVSVRKPVTLDVEQ